MSKRRVVITGIGHLSPVGNTSDEAWNALVNAQSGIDYIAHFDTSHFATKFAGLIKNFEPGDIIPRKELKKMDLFIQYGLVAAEQAVVDSGLDFSKLDVNRVGVSVGSGIGGIGLIEENNTILVESGPRRISPFFVPSTIVNMVSGHISIKYQIKGPNLAISTACASGVHNIGISARIIAYGDADIMIAGGTEKASTPMGIGGFCAARALSTRNEDPKAASRPWDKDRDGFVLGDGAGVLILEEYEHAKKRGAKIYAEIAGFGMSGDGYHMTSPPADGSGAANAMFAVMKDANVIPEQVGYINAHGTSTGAGDVAETYAVKRVFGEYAKSIMVSSTKSMTGHLLGAAGAVESIYTVLALKNQEIPPTINLDNPDTECDLDYVPHTARQVKNMEYAICNSFGFGGTNATLIFRKI